MRLNLGCGEKKLEGYVNVDVFGDPSKITNWDLEVTPWPWETSSVSEIRMCHVMEHLGGDSKTFCNIMKELYRVCKDGAPIFIDVPHPRHDHFLNDPTHVRPITPELFAMFDRSFNDECVKRGYSNSRFAHMLDVDFRTIRCDMIPDPMFATLFNNNREEVLYKSRLFNNVIQQYSFELKVMKEK